MTDDDVWTVTYQGRPVLMTRCADVGGAVEVDETMVAGALARLTGRRPGAPTAAADELAASDLPRLAVRRAPALVRFLSRCVEPPGGTARHLVLPIRDDSDDRTRWYGLRT